jgi:hypothetical protein
MVGETPPTSFRLSTLAAQVYGFPAYMVLVGVIPIVNAFFYSSHGGIGWLVLPFTFPYVLCPGALGDRPLAQPPLEPSPAPSIRYRIHPRLHRPDSASLLGCHVFDQQLARDIASLDAVLGHDVATRESSRITVPMKPPNEPLYRTGCAGRNCEVPPHCPHEDFA